MKKIFILSFFFFFTLVPLVTVQALTSAQDTYKNNCEWSASGASYDVSTGKCTCPSGYYCYESGCMHNTATKNSPSSCTTGVGSSGGTGGTGGTGGVGGSTGGSTGGGSDTTIVNPLTTNSFDEIINNVTDFLFKIALVVGPLMIVIAGFMLMTAADDTEKVTKAKQIIFYTLIGLFIVLFARGLVSVLKNIIGVKK